MAVIKDLVIRQGKTLRLPMLWRDSVTKAPIDLTGCDIFLQARAAPASTSQVLISASTDDGKIVIDADPTTGKFTLTLPSAYTSELTAVPAEPLAPANRAVFELVAVFADTTTIELRRGNIIFHKAVYFPA